jgi:hypothetical protein
MKTSTPTTPAHTTPLLVLLERFLNKRRLFSRAFLSALSVLLMPGVADAAMGPGGVAADAMSFLAKVIFGVVVVVFITLLVLISEK